MLLGVATELIFFLFLSINWSIIVDKLSRSSALILFNYFRLTFPNSVRCCFAFLGDILEFLI